MYISSRTDTAPTVLRTARVFVRTYVAACLTANLLAILYAWKYSVCVVYVCAFDRPLGIFEFHVLPICCEYDAGHYTVWYI